METKLEKDFEDFDEEEDVHLWLADLKKEMEFDSHAESEGARKLVEMAGFALGTHGYQKLKEEVNESE